MKKIIILVLIALTISTKEIKAQAGVTDTLAYLQTIVANKSQYVGQPFQHLIQNLQIQIKFFFPFANLPYDKSKETSTSFSFYFPQSSDDIHLTYPHLEVYWQIYLNADQSRALKIQHRSIGWNSIISNFYANAIVADIKIRE